MAHGLYLAPFSKVTMHLPTYLDLSHSITSMNGAAARAMEPTHQGVSDANLRVCIEDSVCAGVRCIFTLDSVRHEDDFILRQNETALVIDPVSLQHLQGAQIDLQEDSQGSRRTRHGAPSYAACDCAAAFCASSNI